MVILNLNSFRPKVLIDIRRNKSYSHIKGSIYIRAALKLRPNDISSTRRRVLKKKKCRNIHVPLSFRVAVALGAFASVRRGGQISLFRAYY